jgi:hypothetical protein
MGEVFETAECLNCGRLICGRLIRHVSWRAAETRWTHVSDDRVNCHEPLVAVPRKRTIRPVQAPEQPVAPVVACETPEGCTCGAPASTPVGMHRDDCALRGTP